MQPEQKTETFIEKVHRTVGYLIAAYYQETGKKALLIQQKNGNAYDYWIHNEQSSVEEVEQEVKEFSLLYTKKYYELTSIPPSQARLICEPPLIYIVEHNLPN